MLTRSERRLEPGELLCAGVTMLTPAKDTVTPVMSTIRLVCPVCDVFRVCNRPETRLCRNDECQGAMFNHCNFVQNITDYVAALLTCLSTLRMMNCCRVTDSD